MTRPDVTVVIRTLNEARWIEECIDRVRDQEVDARVEVVVVDSGSSDDTVARARGRGARILEIPREAFTYASALNLGFEAAAAPLVVSLSAHALPSDRGWLGPLLAAFDDPEVVGVCSREVPHDDADVHERARLASRFESGAETFRKDVDGVEPPGIFFTNVSSCVRRSMWADAPWPELPYGEDFAWAWARVAEGHAVRYEPASCVVHSHAESMGRRVARELAWHRALGMVRGRPVGLREAVWNARHRVRLGSGWAWRNVPGLGGRLYWAAYHAAKEARFLAGVLSLKARGDERS